MFCYYRQLLKAEFFQLIPKRLGSRGRGLVIKAKDVSRLTEKYERMYTKLMQKKFGIRHSNSPKDDLLIKIDTKGIIPNQLSDRRVKIYEKILLDHVLHLVASEQKFDKIRDYKLEISKVKFLKDFSFFNIYWITTGTVIDTEIQNILNESTDSIRYQLTQFNDIGRIPRVRFVPDVSGANLSQIENLLNSTEYPADHIPMKVYIRGMRSDPTIESSPSDYKVVSDVIKNREDVESKSASSPNFIGEKIFGLDRTQLLKSLWSKKKSKQLKGSGEPQHDS